MNWRRGFFRIAIVLAVFVVLPLGVIGYADWRENRYLASQQEGIQIPDARVISRSAIPTSPTHEWPIIVARFGLVVIVVGAGWWVVSGFRRR